MVSKRLCLYDIYLIPCTVVKILFFFFFFDIRVVFTSFKVKNYFSLECRTPLPLLANVVYKFKCMRDANNIYIGKTIRHLATWVKEHGTSPSAVSNHFFFFFFFSFGWGGDRGFLHFNG